MDLNGKLALVTGAGSGIGRATALALAGHGARVIVSDIDRGRAERVGRELGAACALAIAVDVGDRDAMRAFAERVHAEHGPVDVLVNNAGIGVGGGLLDTSLEQWDQVLGVNLMGVVHGCHFFVPPMCERGRGHVINVSSILGLVAAPRLAAYVTSKFGVLGLSRSLRAELAPRGVRVSAVCPGTIATDIIRGAPAGAMPDAVRARLGAHFARRGAPPERVATAVLRTLAKNPALTPVTLEAWLGWGISRLAPGVAERVSAWLAARAER